MRKMLWGEGDPVGLGDDLMGWIRSYGARYDPMGLGDDPVGWG